MTAVFMIAAWILLLFLEFKLAFKENKWVGLIIPGISLMLSVFSSVIMYRYLITLPEAQPVFIDSMVSLVFMFANIPTAIYLVMYIIGRLKMRKKNQLKKMNIKDLE